MKKLLLLAAFGLLASPALAQNVATTNSNGNGNDATVEQTYTAGASSAVNTALIEQDGDQHQARIEQVGADNLTEVDQDGYSHNATSEIRSFGYSNDVYVTQIGGSAGSGGNNTATSHIRGDENLLNMDQDGDGNNAHVGLAQQRNNNNVLDVDQIGSGNELDLRFKSRNDRNNITTYQEGNDNSLGIRGGGSDGIEFANEADDNTLTANQEGDLNDADINLAESSTFNNVDLDQLSNSNYADIDIDGFSNTVTVMQSGSNGNMATANVMGDNNTSTITQN